MGRLHLLDKMRLEVAAALAILLTVLCGSQADDSQRKDDSSARFLSALATYSTTTYTVVSVSTSSMKLICYSGIKSATICAGRRRKRKVHHDTQLEAETESDNALESSKDQLAEPVEPVRQGKAEGSDPEGRLLGFTVWTTAKSTTSVTVFYTDTATTVKVSIGCAVGGGDYVNYVACG